MAGAYQTSLEQWQDRQYPVLYNFWACRHVTRLSFCMLQLARS